MTAPKILIIAHNSETQDFLASVLDQKGGFRPTVGTVSVFDELSGGHDFQAAIVESGACDANGGDLSELLAGLQPRLPYIVFAPEGSVKESVAAIKGGALDYLTAPISPDDILTALQKATHRPGGGGGAKSRFGNLVGDSQAMRQVFRTIEKVSRADSTVLLTGESGTGKELIARAIHMNSERRNSPLVVINCGAIPGELLESELFGHEKGAFTGAHRTRIGRFEMADGGTMFLDEIGDMSPNLQVKLLRVLQEQTFERVGSARSIHVDIRVIAATNKNLRESIDENTFREDLYYRLNVIPIHVPPLRERKSDIPLLIDFFVKQLSRRRQSDVKRFSDDCLAALKAYDWPGNVRELENMVERLSVLVDEDVVQIADLPEHICGEAAPMEDDLDLMPVLGISLDDGLDFNETVEQYQRRLIVQALNQTNWIKAKAAELLKMNRTTLVEKIKKMKITSPGEAPEDITSE